MIRVYLIIAAVVTLVVGVSLGAAKHYYDSAADLRATIDTQKDQIDNQKNVIANWEKSYKSIVEEWARVNGIVADVQKERDATSMSMVRLREELEKEKRRDKCAQAAVPSGYLTALRDGLPSNRKAPRKPATGDTPGADRADTGTAYP